MSVHSSRFARGREARGIELPNVNAIADVEERKAATVSVDMYRKFEANRARGMDYADAIAEAGFAALTAASLAIGPWGPLLVLGGKALYDALKMSGAAPESLVEAPAPGTPIWASVKPEGYNYSGLWDGPLVLFYRPAPPDWLARELQALGHDPATFWQHIVKDVKPTDWADAAHFALYDPTMMVPGSINQFGWGTSDYPKAARFLIERFPYQPKNVSRLLGRLGTTRTTAPTMTAPAPALSQLRMQSEPMMGATKPAPAPPSPAAAIAKKSSGGGAVLALAVGGILYLVLRK